MESIVRRDDRSSSFQLSGILPHCLLVVNAGEVILASGRRDACVPSWVLEQLQETPWVVVRRGGVSRNLVPVGIRGSERSQRWAALCPAAAILQTVTPADLLKRFKRISDPQTAPAFRALRCLAVGWHWVPGASWGPGGSVGFELATGKRTITPLSDLDIVVYANEHLSRSDARRLLDSTLDLEVTVDVRVETPVCGFSLAEYARQIAKSLLLRTSAGPILGDDPWNGDLRLMSMRIEDRHT